MKPEKRASRLPLFVLAVSGVFLLIGGLSMLNSARRASPSGTTTGPQATPLVHPATSAWDALLEKTPVAYTTPLPAAMERPLDGTYTKVDPSWPQWWLCRRCADYRAAGGIWKLQFDQGVMRIYYEVTGWMSIASYTVTGDRLEIFNDPHCPQVTGVYTWHRADGNVEMEVHLDECSFGLRGKNLSRQAWHSCLPPKGATGTGDLWSIPPGCEEKPAHPSIAPPSSLQVSLNIYGGDSRFLENPPDIYAYANSADTPSPKGIRVTYHRKSIPVGLNRVLWWEGDWIQATTDLSFSSMGVQFLGDPQIGWARVLFDGDEVWRGNTSAIWSERGRHGGYIEVSGFGPGAHTIRAESLGFDYRPVTVASFGFSDEGSDSMHTP